ncbi:MULTISPECIES: phage tail assembly protein [Pantoea]|uniref:Phage tail assembly protein n=1 Tax=Pantoea vagans TaxID=470934 RepID=A0ABY3LKF2_9GAMM|nr:phage tail assembly protein [Pantoea sp. S62]MBK5013926.1 phage tail assembly protein [Pantoea sp. S62]TXL80783.1 phage tail assembly protein [Pantoea vagans]
MSYPGEIRTIMLFTPVTLEGGGELNIINMREPLVRDRIAHAKDRGNEEEKEARMIAQLCNLSEQDIWLLTAADYAQLTDAFNVFMLPPAERPKES